MNSTKRYRCRVGHFALHDDGRCHAAVFGEECGLQLLLVSDTADRSKHQHVQYLPDGRIKIRWSDSGTTIINDVTLSAADCEDPNCPSRYTQ